MAKRKREVVDELQRIVTQLDLPVAARDALSLEFFQRIQRDVFAQICIEALDYQTLLLVEQISFTFKSVIVQKRVWMRKFKHDFSALRNIEMTPDLRRYLDERSVPKDPAVLAQLRDYMGGPGTMTVELDCQYTAWKRYYELLIRLQRRVERYFTIEDPDVDGVIAVLNPLITTSKRNPGMMAFIDGPNRVIFADSVAKKAWMWIAEEKIYTVAFSSDDKVVAVSTFTKIVMISTETGRPTGEVVDDFGVALEFLAFSPDGRTLAGAWGRSLSLYDVTPGSATYGTRTVIQPVGDVYCTGIEYADDGTHLTVYKRDGTYELWGIPPSQDTLVSSRIICSHCRQQTANYRVRHDNQLAFCGVECAMEFGPF